MSPGGKVFHEITLLTQPLTCPTKTNNSLMKTGYLIILNSIYSMEISDLIKKHSLSSIDSVKRINPSAYWDDVKLIRVDSDTFLKY